MDPITLSYVVASAPSLVTTRKPEVWQRGRVAHGPVGGDGDGWVCCRDGQRRWGYFGAAGLLLRAPDPQRRPLVLMQHRAPWTHHGDRWGLPGGARRSEESAVEAVLREAAEETAVDPARVRVRVRGEVVEHPGHDAWSFTTVVADAAQPLPVLSSQECSELAWIPEPEVAALDLHPAFAASWPALRVPATGLIVDGANVVGSRPDGWWRDRAGAAERLLREVAAAGPGVLALTRGDFGWVDRLVVVLEGVANRAPDVPGVEVIRAPGIADDTIVEIVRAGGAWVVSTADRALRARLPPHARSITPTTLRSWLTPPTPSR